MITRPNPDAPPGLKENDIHGGQLHIYTEDQDEVHDIISDIRSLFDSYSERVAIGELWGPLDRWVRYYGAERDGGGDELHLPFNFRLMDSPWQAQAMRRWLTTWKGRSRPTAGPITCSATTTRSACRHPFRRAGPGPPGGYAPADPARHAHPVLWR